VCVFDGTYYKITITNYISKTSLRSCMSSGIVWRIYVEFVTDIDIKILRETQLFCTYGGATGMCDIFKMYNAIVNDLIQVPLWLGSTMHG